MLEAENDNPANDVQEDVQDQCIPYVNGDTADLRASPYQRD